MVVVTLSIQSIHRGVDRGKRAVSDLKRQDNI